MCIALKVTTGEIHIYRPYNCSKYVCNTDIVLVSKSRPWTDIEINWISGCCLLDMMGLALGKGWGSDLWHVRCSDRLLLSMNSKALSLALSKIVIKPAWNGLASRLCCLIRCIFKRTVGSVCVSRDLIRTMNVYNC